MIQKMQKMMSRKNKKGFTLIELIVVIAIIAILAAIAIPRLGGFTQQSKVKADYASARTIAGAASIYEAETGVFPGNIGALVPKYLDAAPVSQSVGGAFTLGGTSGTNMYVDAGTSRFYPQ